MSAATNLDDLGQRIREAHVNALLAAQNFTEYAIKAGRLLAEAKVQLKHGAWLPWLAANLPEIKIRTVQNYMRVAEHADKAGLTSSPKYATRVAYLGFRETLERIAKHRDLDADEPADPEPIEVEPAGPMPVPEVERVAAPAPAAAEAYTRETAKRGDRVWTLRRGPKSIMKWVAATVTQVYDVNCRVKLHPDGVVTLRHFSELRRFPPPGAEPPAAPPPAAPPPAPAAPAPPAAPAIKPKPEREVQAKAKRRAAARDPTTKRIYELLEELAGRTLNKAERQKYYDAFEEVFRIELFGVEIYDESAHSNFSGQPLPAWYLDSD